ncbi:MAG TPA: hypothetical protein VJH89_02730, partial [Patescibacteria group bacterium]|nr:hypothetical protein [Patescibacteria group bacterium]
NDVLDGNILYQWSVNKQNRPASSDPLNFTLVKSGNKQESQTISLSAQNPKRILQSGATQAMVSFTSEE